MPVLPIAAPVQLSKRCHQSTSSTSPTSPQRCHPDRREGSAVVLAVAFSAGHMFMLSGNAQCPTALAFLIPSQRLPGAPGPGSPGQVFIPGVEISILRPGKSRKLKCPQDPHNPPESVIGGQPSLNRLEPRLTNLGARPGSVYSWSQDSQRDITMPQQKGANMPNIREIEEVIVVIGHMGSDGGYSVVTPHGVKHVPGNNPMAREAFQALKASYTKLQEIAQKERAG
jgi:hypothetical protein